MKLEIRNLMITTWLWIIAIIIWFFTTVACTVYTTAKLNQFTENVHADHALLIRLEVESRSLALDRDLEFRKRLLTLQDSLVKMQEQQQLNTVKINLLRQLLAER